ncbi:MAG: helix-turn-helix domain-containing protein [Granulosicoccus sp.]
MSTQILPESLGQDLRILRKRRGLTLASVAKRMRRSVGWLSQVERNLSAPSSQELDALADVLDFNSNSLRSTISSSNPCDKHVVRSNNRRPLGPRIDGLTEALLSPDLTDDFEVVHSTFAPGAQRHEPLTRPTQEVGYIVSGTLKMRIGNETFKLNPGDSFRIRGEPFSWANPGKTPCIAIWVIAPPVY